jgi:hypothetical protein
MTRVVAAAGLLLSLAAIASGCGGTSPQAAALRVAASVGGTRLTALRVARVRLVNGSPADAVVLRGRFCGHGAFHRPPGHPRRCRDTFAQIMLKPGSHQPTISTVGAPWRETTAIHAAWSATPAVHVFPDFPDSLISCRVPTALAGGGATGTCVSRWVGPRRPGSTRVAFIAAWPLSAPEGKRHRGGWEVTVGQDGHVLAVKLYRHQPARWR